MCFQIKDAFDLAPYTEVILNCGYTGPINLDHKESIIRCEMFSYLTKHPLAFMGWYIWSELKLRFKFHSYIATTHNLCQLISLNMFQTNSFLEYIIMTIHTRAPRFLQ